jgi:hypothetical protein
MSAIAVAVRPSVDRLREVARDLMSLGLAFVEIPSPRKLPEDVEELEAAEPVELPERRISEAVVGRTQRGLEDAASNLRRDHLRLRLGEIHHALLLRAKIVRRE